MWNKHFRYLIGLAAVSLAAPPVYAQEAEVVGYSMSTSSREAVITFHLSDGRTLPVGLARGRLRIGNVRVGEYTTGGPLEEAWRSFLRAASSRSTAELVAAAREWTPEGLSGEDAASAERLRELFGQMTVAATAPIPDVAIATGGPAVAPDVGEIASVASEAAALAASRVAEAAEEARRSAAEARSLRDELRTSIQNDVRNRIRVDLGRGDGDFRQVRAAGPVEAAWHGLLALLGTFVALMGVGFGISFFADRQLDVMAHTVQRSFGRAFFVGLFAQPLVLPVFLAMIVGLAATIIGVLVIPVAIIAFVIALAAAVAGGYLAVARVLGARFLARKQQDYGLDGIGMLRSLAYGVGLLLALWLPAVVLGWAPVAGTILTWTAAVLTWGLATTGFGAAILTRGGLRGTFGQRFAPQSIAPDHILTAPVDDPLADEVDTAEWLAEGRPR